MGPGTSPPARKDTGHLRLSLPVVPDFLILGAPKCGTTSLAAALRSHPDIFLPAAKEAHHFGVVPDTEAGGAAYARFFSGWQGQPVLGEATPGYLQNPDAARQIARVAPRVRAVALVRNPVDRAYSSYWHGVRSGWIHGPFEQILEHEPRFATQPRVGFHRPVSGGRYAESILRYHRVGIGPDQLLVVTFEDLVADPASHLAEIQRHIGVAPVVDELPRQNRNMRNILPRHLRKAVFIRRQTWPLAGRDLRLANRPFTPPPMNPITRRGLVATFAPHNEALRQLLGRDLPGWDQ